MTLSGFLSYEPFLPQPPATVSHVYDKGSNSTVLHHLTRAEEVGDIRGLQYVDMLVRDVKAPLRM